MSMSFNTARSQALEQHNMRITRKDGECRVSYPEDMQDGLFGNRREEASAYYTDDVEDAYFTAIAMRKSRDKMPGVLHSG